MPRTGGSLPTWIPIPPTLSASIDELSEDSVPAHERRPITFPYEVSLSDAETFLVDATTDSCDCRWVIELSWAAEGHVGTVVIDDNGKSFHVTGTSNITVSCLTSADGEECRAPSAPTARGKAQERFIPARASSS
jgi:hypothetical protein